MLFAASPFCTAATAPRLTLSADRPEAVYKKGEPVHFAVRLSPSAGEQLPAHLELRWETSRDGVEPKQEGVVTLKDGVGEIVATLDEPGFLRCKVSGEWAATDFEAVAGAAVEPLEIVSKQVLPDDFDSFWAVKKRELGKIAPEPLLTPVPPTKKGVLTYDVQLKAWGKIPLSAYYARPAKARLKSLPAIISLHEAGVASSSLVNAVQWAERGMLSIDMNAHGLPNGRAKAYYAALRAQEYRTYPQWGRFSRDDSYFLGMYLRVIRAVDFLTSQPEWDGRTVIVRGTGQGAAQALAAAGLDERVTFFVAGMPAMAELSAPLTSDPTSWPQWIPMEVDGTPNRAATEASRYFDAVNFMRRSKAEGFFIASFLDATCPPTTTYAAYNALSNGKAIFNDIAAGHENTPEAVQKARAAILRHIAREEAKE